MKRYKITAKVDQIITRQVAAEVDAQSEDEASSKLREALEVFPAAHTTEGIRTLVAAKTDYWIPRSVDILDIREEKKRA